MGSLSSPTSRAFFKKEVLGWGLKLWMSGPKRNSSRLWWDMSRFEYRWLLQNESLFLSVLPGQNYSQLHQPPGVWKASPPRLLIQTLPDVHAWDKKWRKQHPEVTFCPQTSITQDEGLALLIPAGLSRVDTCSLRTSGHKPDHKTASWALCCSLRQSRQR